MLRYPTCFVVSIIVFVTGCVHRTVFETPYVSGSVLDSSTGSPVGGASVMIEGRTDTAVVTTEDGAFLLAPITHNALLPALPIDLVPPGGRARIVAPGYIPKVISVAGWERNVVVHLSHEP